MGFELWSSLKLKFIHNKPKNKVQPRIVLEMEKRLDFLKMALNC